MSFLLHEEMQVHNLHIQFISETLIPSAQTEAVKMSVAATVSLAIRLIFLRIFIFNAF